MKTNTIKRINVKNNQGQYESIYPVANMTIEYAGKIIEAQAEALAEAKRERNLQALHKSVEE